MATINLDVSGSAPSVLAVQSIIGKIDSSVVPAKARKNGVAVSYTLTDGVVSAVSIVTDATVPLDQVANMVRRFQLYGKVNDRQAVRLNGVPVEVSPFQAYI